MHFYLHFVYIFFVAALDIKKKVCYNIFVSYETNYRRSAISEMELKKIFASNYILRAADQKNIEKFISQDSVVVKDFCSGDQIFSPSSVKKHVGIILSGTAIVSPVSGSENSMLKMISYPDMFGISNLYSRTQPFPSIITAKKNCRVLFIDGDSFMSLIENDTTSLKAYLEVLSDKIVYLNQKISTLTAGSTEKKLAFFLAENSCNGEFSQTISMSALADMLNVGRASLYRALDCLSAGGIILREGKKIIITDKNALLNFN